MSGALGALISDTSRLEDYLVSVALQEAGWIVVKDRRVEWVIIGRAYTGRVDRSIGAHSCTRTFRVEPETTIV